MVEVVKFVIEEYAQQIFWATLFLGVVLVLYIPIKWFEKRKERAFQDGFRHFSESNGMTYFSNEYELQSLKLLFGEHLNGFSSKSAMEGVYRGINLKILDGAHSSRRFLQDQTLVCYELKKARFRNFSLEFMGDQEVDIEQEEKEVEEFGSFEGRKKIREIVENKISSLENTGSFVLDVHCYQNALMFAVWMRIPLASLENYLGSICEIIYEIDR